MGLGPAVCQHCKVLAAYSEEPMPVVRNASTTTLSEYTHWYCRFCGETDPHDSAGLNMYRIKQLEDRERDLEKFYDFWKMPYAPRRKNA